MNATARLPKRDSPLYDGIAHEEIVVVCGECPATFDLVRMDLPLLATEDGWVIERDPETGRVLATCDRCREKY